MTDEPKSPDTLDEEDLGPDPEIDQTQLAWSPQEVLDCATWYRRRCTIAFNRFGEHRPMAVLFTTKNPNNGDCHKATTMVPVLGDFSEPAKESFSKLLKVIALAGGASAILFVSEVWMVQNNDARSKEEAEELMQKWAGRLGEHPDRKELLMMTVEHRRFGSLLFTAPIIRSENKDEKPKLGPWQDEEQLFPPIAEARSNGHSAKVKFEGRFVHLLPEIDG